MTSRAELRVVEPPDGVISLHRERRRCGDVAAEMYRTIGAAWHWVDRAEWTPADWDSWLDRDGIETWVATVDASRAGFVMLDGSEEQKPGEVEILYLGLQSEYTGRGLGGWLLSEGTRQAWAMGARVVWVHTCSLDGPHALRNYQQRGFQVVSEVTEAKDVSGVP